MKQIRHSDFPLEEYELRVNRASKAMAEAGLDALIVTDPANLRYLFGFQNLLVMSANRTFVGMFVRDNPEESAIYITPDCQDAPQSWCENVCFWSDGMKPPFDERFVDVNKIASRLRELGLERSRIGMEVGQGARVAMPIEQFDELRKALSEASIINCTGIFWSLRKIKSAAEIDVLRRVAEISANAHKHAIANLEEGMGERDLYCKMQSHMFSQGVDGLGLLGVLFGADGWRRANMSPTDDRKLKSGDSVYLDGGGMLQGYNADMCRMSTLGEPEARHSATYETVKRTQRAMIDVIRPGIPCCEVYKIGRSLLEEEGLGYMVSTLSFGHGLGLNVHEMPDLSLENDEPLQEGMVLAIEPWIIDYDKLGLFNQEDMVVVRKDDAELLSAT